VQKKQSADQDCQRNPEVDICQYACYPFPAMALIVDGYHGVLKPSGKITGDEPISQTPYPEICISAGFRISAHGLA